MTRTFLSWITVLAGALLVLPACEETPEGMGEERDKAKIIFVNAAVNGATDPAQARREVAIYPYYNGVQFNNFPIKFPWSNGYKAFEPGSMTIQLDTARSLANDPPGPSAKVTEVTFPTQADSYYSVYAVGTVQNTEVVVLADDLSLPAPGKAKIRIMHFSPDAGAVDVVATAGPGITAPVVLASGVAYKGVREFFEVDPGTYTVEMREAGTANRIGSARSGILIDANSCYSVWAAGFRTLPSTGTFNGYRFDIRYHANRWTNPLVK